MALVVTSLATAPAKGANTAKILCLDMMEAGILDARRQPCGLLRNNDFTLRQPCARLRNHDFTRWQPNVQIKNQNSKNPCKSVVSV